VPREKAADDQIIEDWARGLDWVKWLLGSVRARMEVLMVECDTRAVTVAWDDFAADVVPAVLGPALKSAWQCAHAGDVTGLIAADVALSAQLSPAAAKRSRQAGALLLKSTRQARYQGVLGRLREAVGKGDCSGHLAVVWAAVGHFFQLSLTNVIAEYLHLEWDIATRDGRAHDKPTGQYSIAQLTSLVMHLDAADSALRVVDA
jgi:hypothetical protein